MANNFDRKLWLPLIHFRVLLHAANMWRGTNGFTSLPKESVLRIFFAQKNLTASAGFEPTNLGTKGQACVTQESTYWKWFSSKMVIRINMEFMIVYQFNCCCWSRTCIRTYTHTHTHARMHARPHYVDLMAIFTVGYVMSREICIDHVCTKDSSHLMRVWVH